MQETKAKRGILPDSLMFIAFWAGSYALSWGIAINLLQSAAERPPSENNLGAILIVFVSSAVLQSFIMEYLLKQPVRGWARHTLLGVVITFCFFIFRPAFPAEFQSLSVTALALFMPISLLQTSWLWPHVTSAWLWPLVGLAGCFIFAIPMRNGETEIAAFMMACLLYGGIQGAIMSYLWKQPEGNEIDAAQGSAAIEDQPL